MELIKFGTITFEIDSVRFGYKSLIFKTEDLTKLSDEIRSIVVNNINILKPLMKNKKNERAACSIVYSGIRITHYYAKSNLVNEFLSGYSDRNEVSYDFIYKYCEELVEKSDYFFTRKEAQRKVTAHIRKIAQFEAKKILYNITMYYLTQLIRE